jgi:hypothetical protein
VKDVFFGSFFILVFFSILFVFLEKSKSVVAKVVYGTRRSNLLLIKFSIGCLIYRATRYIKNLYNISIEYFKAVDAIIIAILFMAILPFLNYITEYFFILSSNYLVNEFTSEYNIQMILLRDYREYIVSSPNIYLQYLMLISVFCCIYLINEKNILKANGSILNFSFMFFLIFAFNAIVYKIRLAAYVATVTKLDPINFESYINSTSVISSSIQTVSILLILIFLILAVTIIFRIMTLKSAGLDGLVKIKSLFLIMSIYIVSAPLSENYNRPEDSLMKTILDDKIGAFGNTMCTNSEIHSMYLISPNGYVAKKIKSTQSPHGYLFEISKCKVYNG